MLKKMSGAARVLIAATSINVHTNSREVASANLRRIKDNKAKRSEFELRKAGYGHVQARKAGMRSQR
jgi:hypothetical protein